MISIDTKTFEKLISDFIDAHDISSLVNKFSKDRTFYYNVIKDISRGRSSVNYKILKKVAHKKKVSENFIIEQAKSFLSYIDSYNEPDLDKYYDILNVPTDASDEKIRQQWIELMKSHHPDIVGQGELERAKKINEAYEVISSSKKRIGYDFKYVPDVPIIVKDDGMGSVSKMFLYLVPFILVIAVSYLYLSSSGLLFKSEANKERFAKNIENPTLPKTEIKSEKYYTEIEPESKLMESEKLARKSENIATNDKTEKKSPNINKDVTPKRLYKQKNNSRQGQTVALNTENKEQVDINDPDNSFKSTPEEVPDYQTKVAQDGNSLGNVDSENKDNESLYVVKKGDSLGHIAVKFGISVKDLKSANALTNDNLSIGKVLRVPGSTNLNKVTAKKAEPADESRPEFVKIIPDEYELESGKADKKTIITSESTLKDSSDATIKFDSNLVTPAVAVNDSELRHSELYLFVSQFVSAYKNRDLQTIRSLFAPNAKENGVSILEVFDAYKSNFSALDIIRYDIKVKNTNVDNFTGVIIGDFILTYRNQANGLTKSSRGNITWLLRWRGHKWEIEEINYKIHDTNVID